MPADGAMPRLYTLDEKIAYVTKVDQLLRAGLGKMAAAEAAGTNWASYTNWVKAGVRPTQRPSPVLRTPEEKARLVAAVQARVGDGLTIKAACLELGVPEERFFKWRKQIAPPPPLRPVAVEGAATDMVTALVPVLPAPLALVAPPVTAPEPPPAGLCLVAPGGYRIEGLGVESAAALLRALA